MTRRDFVALPAAAAVRTQAAQRKPNIIFILADDLGYGDLGCYGQQKIRTPNLDRMAAEGTRFTQAYSGSTVCAPSRCCLMTGRTTGHGTVRGNLRPELGIAEGEVTVASLLKRAGYRTALFGKWGLGGPGTGSVPNTRGFDRFYGYLDQLHAHNSYPDHLWDNQNEDFIKDNWFDQRKVFSNDRFTERALDFIPKQTGPFFLYLPYTIPHANNELGVKEGAGIQNPDTRPYEPESWPENEKKFAASITRLDRDIGALFDTLKRKGMDENTLVIFTSDNGPHKEGGHSQDFFKSSGPLRGTKRDLYEGGVRVPSIARWPGKVPAGRTSDFIWAFWDFLPTAAELAGAAAPTGIDGLSFARALTGNQPQHRRALYWEFHEAGFHQAVRRDNWKLIRQGRKQQIELFDLGKDLAETNNVASEQPGVVRELQPLFKSMRTESKHFPVKA